MYQRTPIIPVIICVVVCAALFAAPGCKHHDSASHDTHSHDSTESMTFKESAIKLVSLRNTIRDGFAEGDLDKAHGPLHEVGHVLEHLAAQAQKENLSDENVDAIKAATEELLDAFGEVDKTFHGGEGATYEEVEEKVNSATRTITDIAGVENPTANSDSESNESTQDDVPQNVDASVPDSNDQPIDASGG